MNKIVCKINIMKKIEYCPNCSSRTSGMMVIRCGNCGLVQCENCATPIAVLMRRCKCSCCGTPWRGSDVKHEVLGVIE